MRMKEWPKERNLFSDERVLIPKVKSKAMTPKEKTQKKKTKEKMKEM